MGSVHKDGSQGKLHELFNGFPALVGNRLESALSRALASRKTSDPIRVLDIGAGEVPYRRSLIQHAKNLSLIFLDQSSDLPGRHASGLPDHKWVSADFFNLWPSFSGSPGNDHATVQQLIGGKVDVVLCAASLHELYYDSVLTHGQPIDFHKRFFAFVREHLLKPGGLLLIADYAWPSPSRITDIWRIKAVQFAVVNHADPPWAFRSVSSIQEAARDSGFHLLESSGQGLHDELADDELAKRYQYKLSPCELQTLRTRFGFAAVFSTSQQVAPHVAPVESNARPRCASRYVSRQAQSVFSQRSSKVETELQRLFTHPTEDALTQATSFPPLTHLVEGLREKVEELHPTFSILKAVLEVWTNLGIKGHKQTECKRFVPKLPLQWNSSYTSDEQAAGILSTSRLAHPVDEKGRPFAGRVTIPFNECLSNEWTLHNWFADLHTALRNVDGDCGGYKDGRYVKSFTILAQDESPPNSESTATSLSFANLWGNQCQQQASGHYILMLPPRGKLDYQAYDDLLADRINECLKTIEMKVLGRAEPQIRSLPSVYGTFIRKVFYRTTESSEAAAKESNFDQWWAEKVSDSQHTDNKFPQYRAFTSIILGCDGLSTAPPDSLMIFSSQSIPPDLLLTACEDLATACRRLTTLESEVLIETEAAAKAELAERDRQHRVMVASFGHDGKRPASTIELLLRKNSPTCVLLAQMLSRSLVRRLEAFSALLGSATSLKPQRIIDRLQKENNRAEYWTTLEAIWDEEALNVLLRILVDGSGFREIRRGLFGHSATVDSFASEFKPLLEHLSSEESNDAVKRAVAVRATLERFAQFTPGFSVSYIGENVEIPRSLKGIEGQSRAPLAATSLSFLISEMLTNNAKHQWPALVDDLKADGIQLVMDVVNEEGLYKIDILSRPAAPLTGPVNLKGEDCTITGLTSLDMVAKGLGVTPLRRSIHVNDKLRGDYPFPELRDWTFRNSNNKWSAYTLSDFGGARK